MKDTLHFIISNIVDNAEAVSIDETEEEGYVTFTVHAAKEDMGKVIGKEGKIIRSIRNIMKIKAMKENNDTESFDFEKSEIEENRNYFEKGKLLHAINSLDCGAPFSSDYIAEEEKRFSESFQKLLKLKNEK